MVSESWASQMDCNRNSSLVYMFILADASHVYNMFTPIYGAWIMNQVPCLMLHMHYFIWSSQQTQEGVYCHFTDQETEAQMFKDNAWWGHCLPDAKASAFTFEPWTCPINV